VGAVVMLMATGCLAGENASSTSDGASAGSWSTDTLSIDFATYNPLSLVVKDQGLIEKALGDDVDVEWTQSAGSNKANELLRAGALDVGSTAGSAALLARANGSPIKVIDVYSQPEWSAIVVGPDSDITSVADLKGKKTAQSLTSNFYKLAEEAGADVTPIEGWAQAVELLRQDRVEATVNDKLTFLDYEKTDGPTGLKIAAETDPAKSAVVTTKNKKALIEKIDGALADLREDGTLAEISEKYFGADVTE